MKHISLQESPSLPVSHDPTLMKTPLVTKGLLPGVRGVSHIVLEAGRKVDTHVHEDGFEVFYCIRGEAVAVVAGERVNLSAGHCLVVEPGEHHSFEEITSDLEIIYFFVEKTTE